ncbi:conserved Plasmodium protein, unknown function [Plasmodium knowlesi strain H]|uniref:Uncharacterized protein n=3 Tax=Plasmodium knowlesi TaxID=5850 RepID=A0A5K1U173_PLAKH|nr:conserved Plasmodium protein, unknown function [Plasmodium knowlesi strain H]OTN64838.1 Uncharacterized protein PKNOH_S120144200 [Plasmodium knowlesi]CAA9988299.1 conserved Plasmodium protein, unknown function [Plasmodium knowlesi strain H]SBO20243.1 conserved Plasmodium protein, unknown function [Plasmodium knowlesi strain H]SBO20302.1 conserved Plasmodium protein, unknown function [Plasmodium knowlesi strain H]VVS77773.1 conserved Plasmodium protein, unknown function [Plasmodium knowlesi |eukprot:XP_002259277.1 hypothetical protein, conserved in Plasmodium species [Plasmodium knowlesi strain H]
MRSCYSHKGVSPGKHPLRSVGSDKIGKEDVQSVNNGLYADCTLCGINHKDPHKQALYPLREDQHRVNKVG